MLKTVLGARVRAALLCVGLLGTAVAVAGPAQGQATPPPTNFSASAHGSMVHLDALQVGVEGPRVADTDIAFSAATTNGAGLGTPLISETGQAIVRSGLSDRNSFARASGLALGLGAAVPNDPDERQIILNGMAEASSAPPTPSAGAPNPHQTALIRESIDVPIDPLAYATLLRGESQALWNPNYVMPMLGNPMAFGLARVAGVQLLNLGGTNPDDDSFNAPLISLDALEPGRGVAQAVSFTYLVNNGDGTCGVASEVRQNIAPVRLNLPPDDDPSNDYVIELLGEWRLRAVVTGKGAPILQYAPGGVNQSPQTPVLRILQGTEILGGLNLQDLLGDTGLQIPGLPLLSVSAGEAPRAIAAPGTEPDVDAAPVATNTRVEAAVDAVRVRLLNVAEGVNVLDLRLGHFEVRANVPAGGINCQIPIGKTATPDPAETGQPVTFTITVPIDAAAITPFPCELTNIRVEDVIELERADVPSNPPRINILSGSGPGGVQGVVSADRQRIVFENAGSYRPGQPPLVFTINAEVPAGSGSGLIRDVATATGTPGNCSIQNQVVAQVLGANFFGQSGVGLTGQNILGGEATITGQGVLRGPAIRVAQILAVTGPSSSTTPIVIGAAIAALLSAAALRRLRRIGGSA